MSHNHLLQMVKTQTLSSLMTRGTTNPVNKEFGRSATIRSTNIGRLMPVQSWVSDMIVCANGVSAGGRAVPLRRPNLTTLKNTGGDGNCMFRALSYLITGTQAQHLGVRAAIVRHLLQYVDLFMCSAQVGVNANYNSLSEYIVAQKMDKNKEWGTEVELFAICHLLRTIVYTYSQNNSTWQLHAPSDIDPSLHALESSTDMGMYVYHALNHYMNVCSILNDKFMSH